MTTGELLPENAVDPDELRRAIARIPAPVTVVSGYDGDEPVGFTASSFVNISVDPPLVGVFVGERTRSHATFSWVEQVAINVLADDQSEIATVFATSAEDKFAGVLLDPRFTAVPVVAHAMVTIVGRVVQRPVLGDHLMLVIQAEEVMRNLEAPLVYQDRKFRALTDLLL